MLNLRLFRIKKMNQINECVELCFFQWQQKPPLSVLENPGLVPLIWVSLVTTNVLFLLFSILPLISGPLNDLGTGGSIWVFKYETSFYWSISNLTFVLTIVLIFSVSKSVFAGLNVDCITVVTNFVLSAPFKILGLVTSMSYLDILYFNYY